MNSPMGVAFVVAAPPFVLCELSSDPEPLDLDGAPVKGALLTGDERGVAFFVAIAAAACVG